MYSMGSLGGCEVYVYSGCMICGLGSICVECVWTVYIVCMCVCRVCVCAMCGTVQIILDKWILRYLLALLWCVGIALINKNVLREELGKVFARKK